MEYNKTGYPHPPPPMGVPPQMAPPGGIAQTVVVQPIAVGPDPVSIICPSCGASIVTKMRYEPTTKTHLVALLLFCFICWPCVCLPYCMDSCQNANHYCPNCDAFIGTYNS